MPDTTTPNIGLIQPEIGASRDSWGAKLNQNADTLDSYVWMATPVGCVLDFAGPQVPSGWLAADGRLVSRTTYSDLFAVIGAAFGAGDGSTTFALPNFIGRAGVGPGTMTDAAGISATFTYATPSGYVQNTIAQAHLPNYNLVTDTQGYHAHGGATAPGGNHNHGTDVQGYHSHGGATGAGGDHTHSGYTDAQGNHYHNVASWGFANAQAGAYQVAYPPAGLGYNGEYTDYQGNHSHNVGTYGSSIGNFSLSISGDGNHGHNITYSGNLQLGIYADGNHAHNVTLGGGGQPFTVLSPVLVVTKIIYAGLQASTRITTAALIAPAASEQNELAQLREQIAELRALLLPARRVTHSPTRGIH